MKRIGLIEKYRQFLDVTEKTPVITLIEGDTPLIPSISIGPKIGLNLYFKYEGLNPTGSFKDRGMTMAISKAMENKATAVICASTGNTSASAAAYAARAKIKCFVLIPEGKIALGKLAQALKHGAEVIAINGNFDQALDLVCEASKRYQIELVNSLNPFRLEGQKTASFEICDTLADAPDFLFIPVGNAGNITAYWMGFKQYSQANKITKLPKMMGFQAEGAAPIVRGKIIETPETVATAIRIGNPARWREAEAAAKESDGLIDMVSDDEIINAYNILSSKEGIFVEPASAASVAGLIKLNERKYFNKEDKIVCVLTGHGLKDPDTALKTSQEIKEIQADIKELEKIINL